MNPNDVGNIEDPNNFYSAWEPGSVSDQSDTTWSIVGSVGTRYKLSILSDLMVDYWDENLNVIFTRKKDIRVAAAIAELFRRRENIEIYNKKALYIMIREMADVKTQYITKVVNQMRKIYNYMWDEYNQKGKLPPYDQNSKYF